MNLPPQLAEDFKRHGDADPMVVVRALYDLEGNLGETFVATDGSALYLFTRRVGEPFRTTRYDLTLINTLEARMEGSFACLLGEADGHSFKLKFSGWDRQALQRIVDLWRNLTGHAGANASPAAASESGSSSTLMPLQAFCASLHAMFEADGQGDVTEALVLRQHVPEVAMGEQGRAFLNNHGLEALLQRLPHVLVQEQRRCLYANLVAVSMADGTLRTAENNLLERFRAALELEAGDAERLYHALLIRSNLSVFTDREVGNSERLTPLVAFCAAMRAMMEADGNAQNEEIEVIERLLNDAEVMFAGLNLLQWKRLDGLLDEIGTLLTPEQKACTYANLIEVAMADGALRRREMELLERFKAAMNLPPEEAQAIYDALLIKHNMSIFTG